MARDSAQALVKTWSQPRQRLQAILAIAPIMGKGPLAALVNDLDGRIFSSHPVRQVQDFLQRRAATETEGAADRSRSYRQTRAQARADLVTRLVPRPRRFLDLGSGDGAIAEALAQRWHLGPGQAWALDLAPRPSSPHVTAITYDAAGRIPLRPGSVDLVTAMMVLHHTKDPAAALGQAHRLLRPGGLLLLREHDAQGRGDRSFLEALHELMINAFGDAPSYSPPQNLRAAEQWARLATSQGFEVVHTALARVADPHASFCLVLRKLTGAAPGQARR